MTHPATQLRDLHPGLFTARSLRDRDRRPSRRLSSRIPAVDRLLEGGFTPGSLVEIVGHRSGGRFSIALQALAAFTGRGEIAGLVDLGSGFEPRTAQRAGIELSRLLWVRPQHVKEALISTELLLDTGFSFVVLDLGLPPVPGGRGPEGSWMRLARAAQKHSGVLLVSSPYRASGTAAHQVLETTRRRTCWRGSGHTPRLLDTIESSLRLTRAPGQAPPPPDTQPWRSGACVR